MAYRIYDNQLKIGDNNVNTNTIVDTAAVANTVKDEVVAKAMVDIREQMSDISSLPSGGLTGQVLVKKSNADGDAEWRNNTDKLIEVSGSPTDGSLWISDNIGDYIEVYTKSEIDNLLGEGINIDEELADYYTKSETDARIDTKLNGYYTKAQTDSAITTSANGVKALIPTKYSQLTNDANVVTSPNASNIRILTQSEYDAIGAPSSSILYLIKAS